MAIWFILSLNQSKNIVPHLLSNLILSVRVKSLLPILNDFNNNFNPTSVLNFDYHYSLLSTEKLKFSVLRLDFTDW